MAYHHVGLGQGAFVQETTYRYVGWGAGEFDVVQSGGDDGGAMARCLAILCITGVLAICIVIPVLLFTGVIPIPKQLLFAPEVRAPGSGGAHDCSHGIQDNWGPEKAEWCCKEEEIGCLAPRAPSATVDRAVAGDRGDLAPAAPAANAAFNCKEDAGEVALDWSSEKRTWCCSHGGAGCNTPVPTPPPTPTPTPAPGQANPTTPVLFDCSAGVDTWADGWSLGKKAFCCKQSSKGCT